uniref:G_PROTEIN_RECEP_F1_2 domain-containing protein n=1 Tax=Steinernema glaseri TaxID=37863 RepID=A0A1I7ZCY7_9BILA
MFPGYLIVILSVYTGVFCVGFLGNVWLILTLLLIRIDKKQPTTSNFKRMNQYLLLLSVADLLVLCMIPMLVSYFINGGWKLGFITCKVFWTVENVNKLLSVAILTIMSFERYIGICKPFNQHSGAQYNIGHLLLFIVVFTIFLCSPIIYYSDTVVLFEDKQYNIGHLLLFIVVFTIFLCSPIIYYSDTVVLFEDKSVVHVSCNSDLPDELLPYFILYMCAFGFVIPMILISATSILIVQHVRRNVGSLRRHSPLITRPNRVIRSISAVVVFHFACWTPFWLAVLLTLISTTKIAQILTISPTTLAVMRLITSFLPYINSAGNWIFYAALNRKIQNTSREVRERHQRLSMSPNDASGMIIRALSITRKVSKPFIRTNA